MGCTLTWFLSSYSLKLVCNISDRHWTQQSLSVMRSGCSFTGTLFRPGAEWALPLPRAAASKFLLWRTLGIIIVFHCVSVTCETLRRKKKQTCAWKQFSCYWRNKPTEKRRRLDFTHRAPDPETEDFFRRFVSVTFSHIFLDRFDSFPPTVGLMMRLFLVFATCREQTGLVKMLQGC